MRLPYKLCVSRGFSTVAMVLSIVWPRILRGIDPFLKKLIIYLRISSVFSQTDYP